MTLIGYTMMCEQAGPKQLVRDVALAEEAGFDFAVISDHYFPWLDSQGHFLAVPISGGTSPGFASSRRPGSRTSRWCRSAATPKRNSSPGRHRNCCPPSEGPDLASRIQCVRVRTSASGAWQIADRSAHLDGRTATVSDWGTSPGASVEEPFAPAPTPHRSTEKCCSPP